MSGSPTFHQRRRFLGKLAGSAAAPFLLGLNSLYPARASTSLRQPRRLLIVFTPNGTRAEDFWPTTSADGLQLKTILGPLERFKRRMLVIRGLSSLIGGPGDNHMRGIGGLLTGRELLPGHFAGMGSARAGWASGISIDQQLQQLLQASPSTQTRFGSIELGINVAERADPYTRMCYSGSNQPLVPLSDPMQVLRKLYGRIGDSKGIRAIVDNVKDELRRHLPRLTGEDKQLLQQHMTLVAQLQREQEGFESDAGYPQTATKIERLELANDNIPRLSRIQIELLINAFNNDMARVATLQYTNSVGQTTMNWLGINGRHHTLSHEPDANLTAQKQLTKINVWFSGEVNRLVQGLADTSEPHGEGSLLDNTLVIWTNELGKGNNHSLDDIPFVLIGGEAFTGFEMGRFIELEDKTPHNRLWLSVAAAFGHPLTTFGDEALCKQGALSLGA